MAIPRFVLKPDWRLVVAQQTFLGARNIALRVEALAIERCPVAQGSGGPNVGAGGLKKSHFMDEALDVELGWRFRIGANKSYAYFVHQGTSPHPIAAVNASALHFFWPKGGGYVFFASVNHPGTRPQPWLWESANIIIRSSLL